MNAALFTGPATDYFPKPDNDPVTPVEPGDFALLVPLSEAETKAARLAVERYKRRLVDATPVPTAPRGTGVAL